ncbi:MAG: hypothetical protein ACOC7U_05045, partial [Spirochaetota bacterium]
MAVDKEKKKKFTEEVKYLKGKIDNVNQKIMKVQKEESNENLKKVLIASQFIDMVSIYCAMNDLSVNLLGFKNDSYLDLGRKNLYKAISSLEEVFSYVIDMPLGENHELLKSLDDRFDDSRRLKLVKKIGYTISLLSDRYGKDSKWKWSFVEFKGRYAVLAKNMFDFRSYQEKNNPEYEGFDDRYDYLYLVKDLLIEASSRYREKYELTDHSHDDMKKAIDFLRALKRIHILFNEKKEVQNITKRIELWSQKLEADMKEKEK